MARISSTLFRLAAVPALLCGLLAGALAQDSRPYAPIANPLPDTLDQLYRDSATIKIGRIRVNQAGYRPADDKYFYYVGSGASSFSVINAGTGASVATGTLASKNTTVSGQIKIKASNNAQRITGGDTRYTMESPAVSGTLYEGKIDVSAPGQYRIRVGSETSGAFWIHENLYGWVRDAAIKFPGVNRCGNTESWFHGACHLKDATLGGWHDCGDHLKEGITQSYLHAMLALGSAALRDHDVDNYGRNHNSTVLTDGVPDVLYEAKHGSDYVIRAYDNAGGRVASMITSVGGFGPDHQWWGQPEMHDRMSTERGGPPREARNELGANILGLFAAGLSLTAKNYAAFDSAYAAKSITVAKALYAYAKANQKNTESPAYNGNGESQDKLAFAALGLLYATKDKTYLNDLCYDKTIFNAGSSEAFPNFGFEGGWFAKQPQFSKGFANTDWGSQHMVVLWGFYRLILKDAQFCADINITSSERLKLLGRVAGQMLFNLNDIKSNSGNTSSISLPSVGHWDNSSSVQIVYDDIWKSMHTQSEWMWNRYQFGNIFDLFAYSDMAMWLDSAGAGIQLPGRAAGTNWKGREVRQLVIRQIDYMLGVNLWDYAMIFGIGHKNSNHPHHRAANPEGKNVPGAFYSYRPPVGALQAGVPPTVTGGVYNEHYDNYYVTETGIDASGNMIIPIMGLALPDPITGPPDATVRTVYVGADMAIIEVRQTRFGMSTIRYAQDGAANFTNVKGDSSGVFHRIVLTNLKNDTKYNFDALIADMFGNSSVVLDDRGELFTFTTLKTPPGPADISNVKVCRVTSDSADIFWFTPNGQYDSRVVYGERKPPATVHNGNIYGRPTQFHYVKIGGLKEKTTYYFYVESNGARDDNGGQYYTFTTPVEHVEFDVRALMYRDGGRQFLGLNIVNQDIKSYDSLEFRLYIRAPDSVNTPNGRMAFQNHFAFRVDIGIKYRSDGYQDTHFKGEIDGLVQASRPIKMEDTYNPADNTWGWYVPVPMGPAEMQSGARFRIDLLTDTRSWFAPYLDLMNQHPSKDLGTVDWSFMPHSRASGDPVDYPGIPVMTKDDTDNDYWNVPVNQYITIYRKNEFVWGYSPSASEQQTKKTHYEMSSQITSPLYNPAEEYLFIEQVMPQITVNGWATVTENGVINDIWVNGSKVRDVNSVARYDFATDRWNLAIPVPVKNGGNNIDITIFGGPETDCATCYGCAFSNHSFYLEFRGADPYPSSMKLLSCANQNIEVTAKDSARIDTTCFYVFVDDMNGNLNKEKRDTVWVSIVNAAIGDSIVIPLIESGDSTGRFTSINPINVVSALPSQRGPNEISMDGGQVITVTYVDITDPNDISQISLASRAEFAVPNSAYFRDSQGVGSIDAVYVKYSKAFDAARDRLPDSL
ncbi:MAG: glycoside hydrolase family 9 protein, partial [Chitinispirillales bacterium]|nr:glycoside hydrolase family 9 protein [Chitinispirillales bacterium]